MHRIYGLKIEDEGFLLVFFFFQLICTKETRSQNKKQNKTESVSHTKILGSEKYLLHIFGWFYKCDIWMW